jgi:hypothetical protein
MIHRYLRSWRASRRDNRGRPDERLCAWRLAAILWTAPVACLAGVCLAAEEPIKPAEAHLSKFSRTVRRAVALLVEGIRRRHPPAAAEAPIWTA